MSRPAETLAAVIAVSIIPQPRPWGRPALLPQGPSLTLSERLRSESDASGGPRRSLPLVPEPPRVYDAGAPGRHGAAMDFAGASMPDQKSESGLDAFIFLKWAPVTKDALAYA